jgi:hypothetical protein
LGSRPVVIVSGSAGACSQYVAGSSVYERVGIVCKSMPWAVNPVNADYDYDKSAEPHTSNQHDCADDQDENGIAVRHENHFLPMFCGNLWQ